MSYSNLNILLKLWWVFYFSLVKLTSPKVNIINLINLFLFYWANTVHIWGILNEEPLISIITIWTEHTTLLPELVLDYSSVTTNQIILIIALLFTKKIPGCICKYRLNLFSQGFII